MVLFVLILQHWDVFKYVTEIFILVPALLGLKGNLEMTLASRLSTAVSIQGVGRESHRTDRVCRFNSLTVFFLVMAARGPGNTACFNI